MQANFEVDIDQSEPNSIHVLNSLLTNYSSSQVSIELRDVRNKVNHVRGLYPSSTS